MPPGFPDTGEHGAADPRFRYLPSRLIRLQKCDETDLHEIRLLRSQWESVMDPDGYWQNYAQLGADVPISC